jgi:deoxyribonuclease-4
MPRAVSKKVETDILKLIPPPAEPPVRSRVRIGIHTSTAGGVETAAERAFRLGCSTFQIFSSSPRQWRPTELGRPQYETMAKLRTKYDLNPLIIHANYLINVAGSTPEFHRKSVDAFRAEVQRGIALCADFLVLHPGSFRGGTREEGLARAAQAIEEAVDGLGIEKSNLKITIENTAGAEYSLGGSFEQVAELMERLRRHVPVAACIDTCHTHVAGYDITTRKGFEETMQKLEATVGIMNVGVWHCNDAKAACGSKLDRHQHIGKGMIGLESFRWLLNDPRVAHAAFIAETPIDEPLDDLKNIEALKSCVKSLKSNSHHRDTETRRNKK